MRSGYQPVKFLVALAGMLLLTVQSSPAASHRSTNFEVMAVTEEIARQIAQVAEEQRKQLAVLWLGEELPAWSQPCSIRVTVRLGGSGGATTFAFDRGKVLSQNMHVEGPLDRLLRSVVPHEVMHTILAHTIGKPVPRWADEGCAVLAEDEPEEKRHDGALRQVLGGGRAIPLGRLFSVRDYPPDVMALYAQGHSVTRFLVEKKGRATFLAFLRQGMDGGWE